MCCPFCARYYYSANFSLASPSDVAGKISDGGYSCVFVFCTFNLFWSWFDFKNRRRMSEYDPFTYRAGGASCRRRKEHAFCIFCFYAFHSRHVFVLEKSFQTQFLVHEFLFTRSIDELALALNFYALVVDFRPHQLSPHRNLELVIELLNSKLVNSSFLFDYKFEIEWKS